MFQHGVVRALGVVVVLIALGLHSTATEAVLARPDLDANAYASLVAELAGRIPTHTPEWTDYNASDPGFALLDLFRFLDDLELDVIINEYHGRTWWRDLAIDSEEFLGELAYSLLEAGLVIVLPANEPVPIDWPIAYSVKLDQSFAQLLASARIPEPATVLLLVLGLAGLGFARRRLH